ncbi:Mitotic checkpoint protein BUB3 [Armadillidium vulgare]|nr:Mitotic checkpoint protein BUB3 [Armadillidium vulgare]
MQQLTKWKSRSSWASHSSDLWRGRSSSTDTDASTLRRRRRVNLTLDFVENASQEKGSSTTSGTSTQQEAPSKEGSKTKPLQSKSDSQEDKPAKKDHVKISSTKSHSGSSQKQSHQQRAQRQFYSRHHSSDNQRDGVIGGESGISKGGGGGGGWRLKETLVALSALDVSDTLQQFLPSRLRNSDSRTSLSSSSKNSSPTTSPSFFHRKSFRFAGLKQQKEEHPHVGDESSKDGEEVEEEGANTPQLSQSRNLEEYIMAFQRQLVNLPSYDRGDVSSLRPRSRSVPRVTFEGEADRMSRATPVTRSPSLTPEMARGSSSSHIRSSQLQLPITLTAPSLTVPHLRPTLSAHALYSPRRSSPSLSTGRGHATSTPVHGSPQRSPTSQVPSPIKRPRSCSPFLSPSSQHPSPNSVVSSPRLLSPAVSPISPPRPIEDPRRPSSASSSLTPTPYRRLDSPVYIVVDIPAVHRAVLSCVEEWLEAGGVEIEGNPAVANELCDFFSRVSQCGPPYQQWCDDVKSQWNIVVSIFNF